MKLPRRPTISVPKLGLPHLGRPSLRLSSRKHPVDGEPALLGPPGPAVAPEPAPATTLDAADNRILRRTRLRLMAVSGAVTLVILVVLGVAAYQVVANAINSSEETVLQNYLNRHLPFQPTTEGPEAAELGGESSNTFEIYITPSGLIEPPRGQTVPRLQALGLPDLAGITAARAFTDPTQIDRRPLVSSDGTSYMILTVQAVGPGGTPGWFIQFVQNRTADTRLLGTLTWVLLLGGAAALLAALLAGYLYAGRALVPIRASMTRREAALQRQREFAANASHELRTPLTVIGASVEDLKRNRRSRVQDVGEALGDIDAEVRHMTALVEDLLLLARTDSGVVQVEKVPVDLADVAVEAVSMLSSVADEKDVRLEVDPLPVFVMGDQLRLRQLVTILTDNAVRHTRTGTTVTVHAQPQPGQALLRVEDQGPGVRPDDLPRIFERFWRADDAPAGGTGLGLSIAKWIVEQHGGTIGAYNRTEGGATFWATLPVWAPAGAVDAPAPDADDAIWAPPEDTLAEEQPGLGDEADGDDRAPEHGGRQLPAHAGADLPAHD